MQEVKHDVRRPEYGQDPGEGPAEARVALPSNDPVSISEVLT